eukprot:373989_1
MSTNQSTEKWIHLTAPPSKTVILPNGVDKNNYIVIDWDWQSKKINCICKYNINTDKWTKINGCNDIENIPAFSAAVDTKNQVLFLSYKGYVTQIHLNNGNIHKNTYNVEANYVSGSSRSIIINNSLFVVGGIFNKTILKWNSESQNKTLVKVCDMYDKINMYGFEMVYANKYNYLLLFGARDGYFNYMNYILEFNMKTKQWNKLSLSLPQRVSSICCTMAINNKYVLIFGGFHAYDNIYIYSLQHKTLKQSKIKCPSESTFCAITVNDNVKDEKLTFGYVRNQWKVCDMNHYFPPYYLLKLIHSYYLNEFVYLLDKRRKKHYK